MIKKQLIIALVLTAFNTIKAQDSETLHEKEFSIVFGPTFSNIKNDNIKADPYANSKGGVSFNLGFNYAKYFGKNIGLILGLEMSRYKNTTEYKGDYWAAKTTVDRDNYLYYPVSVANYTVTRTVYSGDVPIQLRLQVPISKQAQFFVDAGVKLNFIASAKIEEKGTLKTKGAYPHPTYSDVYLLIENDPYYGFKNYTYSTKQDMQPARVNFAYVLGFGVKVQAGERTCILINPTYMSSITDLISKGNQKEYINIFNEKTPYKKFSLNQIALRVGVGFYLD